MALGKATLLIVDDEKSTREGLQIALEDSFECFVASGLMEATRLLEEGGVDVVLTDLRLAGENGMELLHVTQKLAIPPVCLVMTAYGSVENAVEAMRHGAWHFLTKPLHLDEVELMLKRAVKNRALEQQTSLLKEENKTLRETVKQGKKAGLQALIGRSVVMQKIESLIEQIAPTRTTVLIEGESGTGKELVARAIHQESQRASKPFVVVNCAALSPQLLESELFGHEKGAFTGASQKRIGRFEQAQGGTLFLDEIGEIDAATQVKLLRALGERSIERVGSNTPVPVDVRIVAATNKHLAQLVAQGDFREDLYFRLRVILLDVPPLRERKEDIVLLAQSFLKEFSKENNKPYKPLSDESLLLLRSYNWPGNIRELRTAIEHGVVMSNTQSIDPLHLPDFLKQEKPLLLIAPPQNARVSLEEKKENTTWASITEETLNLESLEKNAIAKALEQTGDNRTKAAALLGISRRTLQRKIQAQKRG